MLDGVGTDPQKILLTVGKFKRNGFQLRGVPNISNVQAQILNILKFASNVDFVVRS